MASFTFAKPLMFKKVSCWPAKEASGKSSAVAEERTATEISSVPESATIFSHAVWMSASNSAGNGVSITHWRMFLPHSAKALTSSTSKASKAALMRSFKPSWAMNLRKASAVVAKPPGTRTPFEANWLIISPNEAFLPPTCSTSVLRRFSNQITLLPDIICCFQIHW